MVAGTKPPKVESFSEKLARSKSAVVADYHGLSVKQIQKLRRELRKNGAELKVMKNTLARLACKQAGMEEFGPELKGPLAFVLSYDEINIGPKLVLDFARKHPKFKVRGGYAEGATLTPDEVKTLGNLPTLPVLRGMFVMNLKGGPKKFLQLLQAKVEKMGGAEPAPAAAPVAEAPPAEAPAVEAAPAEAAPAEAPTTEAAAAQPPPAEAASGDDAAAQPPA